MGKSSDQLRQEIDNERTDAGSKVDQLMQRVQGLGPGGLGGGLRDTVTSIVEDLRNVVRGEVQLAKTELKDDARQVGKAAGLIGGSGVLAFTGFVFLMLGATHLLNRKLTMWASAGIVGTALLSLAGVLGMVGKNQVQRASLKPEQTIESVKEDVQSVRESEAL